MKKNKPKFNVLNENSRKRVKSRWRKPRGTHNKKRLKMAWAGALPNIGYRNPESIRNLHPNGTRETLVFNVGDLDGLKEVSVRISATVGARKRTQIIATAKGMGLKILNSGEKKRGEKA